MLLWWSSQWIERSTYCWRLQYAISWWMKVTLLKLQTLSKNNTFCKHSKRGLPKQNNCEIWTFTHVENIILPQKFVKFILTRNQLHSMTSPLLLRRGFRVCYWTLSTKTLNACKSSSNKVQWNSTSKKQKVLTHWII